MLFDLFIFLKIAPFQLSHHLNQRLVYGKGERDMILMRHEVTIR